MLGFVDAENCCMFVCIKQIIMARPGNHGYTFSIKKEDHARFKLNCFQNSDDMSEVLNRFMNSYSEASERARKKNKING